MCIVQSVDEVNDDVCVVGSSRVEKMFSLSEDKDKIVTKMTAAVAEGKMDLAESLQEKLRKVKLEMQNLTGVLGEPGRTPPT